MIQAGRKINTMYENILSLETKRNISYNTEAIFLPQDYKKYNKS